MLIDLLSFGWATSVPAKPHWPGFSFNKHIMYYTFLDFSGTALPSAVGDKPSKEISLKGGQNDSLEPLFLVQVHWPSLLL